MSMKLYLSCRICVFAQSVFEIKYSLQNQFQRTIGRAGKCVDDDDDDSGGRTQRNCLTLTAPDRRPSQTRKFGFKGAVNEKFGV